MPERMSHAEYVALQRRRALECARQVLTGRVGIIEGSRLLNALLHEVELPELPELQDAHLTLKGVDSETDHLPLGPVRKRWAPEALDRVDREIREAEAAFATAVAEACRQVLAALERAV